MRIAFDAKRAAQNSTGLGNYSRFVIDSFVHYATDNQYTLFVPNCHKTARLADIRKAPSVTIKSPKGIFKQLFSSLWRVFGIPSELNKDSYDIYHGLSGELPLNIGKVKDIKTIVTIHDLIFISYPQCYHAIDRAIYNYKFRKSCQNADRIIAVSECTKRNIVTFYNIPSEKIDVVYQGCDDAFKCPAGTEKLSEVKAKYNLPNEYVLYVGSIEERKNLLLLAIALKQLPKNVKVIAVGRRTKYANIVDKYLRENQLEQQMTIISNVPFADLPSIYQMAKIFVYPSFFEGFGIPILEAQSCGVPCIGAIGSCLEEVGGPHSIYINPTDDKALAKAIQQLWTNDALRQQMVEQGYEYIKRFEKKALFGTMIETYKRTLLNNRKSL